MRSVWLCVRARGCGCVLVGAGGACSGVRISPEHADEQVGGLQHFQVEGRGAQPQRAVARLDHGVVAALCVCAIKYRESQSALYLASFSKTRYRIGMLPLPHSK